MAVYRVWKSAPPSLPLQQRKQVPHHLLDVVTPDAFYTAGDYSRAARAAIAAIAARGRLPIVTGGTGLYLRALLQGLFPGPQRSAACAIGCCAKRKPVGPPSCTASSSGLIQLSAARIHANDVAKVIRAIEVTLAAGRPMSEAWKEGREPLTGYRVLRLGLDPPRPQLYERINARARAMFAEGLVEETRDLLARYGHAPALDVAGLPAGRRNFLTAA